MKKNKNKDYNFIYNTKNFEQISRKTKAIIVNLYKDYIASDEESKKVDDILKLNSQKLEIEKNRKYNQNDIFNNKNNLIVVNTKQEKNELTCIQKKQSIFSKIIQKIKKL